MKTGIQMLQDASDILVAKGVKNLITGDLYLLRRLESSDKIDIVINGIALTNEQLQRGVFNINIHAPNLAIPTNGKVDSTQPDIASLDTISQAVAEMVKDVRIDTYWLYPQNAGVPIRDEDGSYFVNLRVDYTNINQNFK